MTARAQTTEAPAARRPKALKRTDYESFLASKVVVATPAGFEVDAAALSPVLFPHQRAIVAWALRMGRCAVFADCFLPGTLIFADGAYRPIEECREGMAIETLRGASTIERTMSREYDGDVVEVTTGSGFFPVTVTKDHKFYVLRRQRCVIASRSNTQCSVECDRACPAKDNKPHAGYRIELVAAKDLTLNDCLLFRQPHDRREHSDVSDAYLRLAGLWLAEGHLSRTKGKLYGIHLSFCLDEKETLVKSALEAFGALGVRARVGRFKESKNVLMVEASNHPLATRLLQDFGEHAHGKRLPPWFFKLAPERQCILLRGLFEGDAHIHLAPPEASKTGRLSQHIKLVTVSYELASGVRDALLGMGVRCASMVEAAGTDKRGTNHRQSFRLLIPRRFMGLFGYPVDVIRRDLRQVEHVENGETYTLIPIRALRKRHHRGTVYNLTSAGHDSYLTDAGTSKNCGLGKSGVSLEWARHVVARTGRPVLILAPLAVATQFVDEGEKFGVPCTYAKSAADITAPGVYSTNYERLDGFEGVDLGGVVLDESSILKAYSGTTKRKLLARFADTPYRLAATATPAPNDHQELGNHADFLGVMRADMMLSRWFVNDTSQAGVWRLKGHAVDDFWSWVTSWAVCLSKPSDLGPEYSDEGYTLPALQMVQHVVDVDITEGAGDGRLFRDATLSATKMHEEMRRTAGARAARVAELVAAAGGTWLVWCHTNYEAEELMARIPGAVEVRGDMKLEDKEARVRAFQRGETSILVSKPSVLGFGLNFQHCHQTAFVGLSFSFESMYQAIRRTWRFGQTHEVVCHVVAAETEGEVVQTVQRKASQHREMQAAMASAMRAHGVRTVELPRTVLDFERDEATGKAWTMRLGDCVELVQEVPDASVDFCIHSPPFSSLYVYSDSYRDMGNNADDAAFFVHYGFLLRHLYRVTRPGRLMAVHCKQLVDYKGSSGRAGLRDFRGDCIRAAEAAGWKYHSEVCIGTDPVLEMQRTKSHGLLYKQLRADSSYSRQGLPEYLVIFRKWAVEGDEISPVTHTAESFPLDQWQRFASPVWMDIQRTDVLNVQMARENKDEKHIAPLQLEVIRRAVELWTNPGDLVLSPFAGIGSEGVASVKLGRRFLGFELKRSYWQHAQRHLRQAETEGRQQALFGDDGEPAPVSEVVTSAPELPAVEAPPPDAITATEPVDPGPELTAQDRADIDEAATSAVTEHRGASVRNAVLHAVRNGADKTRGGIASYATLWLVHGKPDERQAPPTAAELDAALATLLAEGHLDLDGDRYAIVGNPWAPPPAPEAPAAPEAPTPAKAPRKPRAPRAPKLAKTEPPQVALPVEAPAPPAPPPAAEAAPAAAEPCTWREVMTWVVNRVACRWVDGTLPAHCVACGVDKERASAALRVLSEAGAITMAGGSYDPAASLLAAREGLRARAIEETLLAYLSELPALYTGEGEPGAEAFAPALGVPVELVAELMAWERKVRASKGGVAA